MRPVFKPDYSPLCPTTNGARHVEQRASRTPSCQDEVTESGQFRLKAIDAFLENPDPRRVELRLRFAPLMPRIRQLRPDGKEIALNVVDYRLEFGVFQKGGGGAENGIQFINLPVGVDTGVVLADLGSIEEPGIAFITGLRINLHQSSGRSRHYERLS